MQISSHLTHRGYPPCIVGQALEKVKYIPRHETLEYKSKTTTDRTPFVITHHPANPPLRRWLRELQPALHQSPRLCQAVPELPVVGERNPHSLRHMLMPSSLPTQLTGGEEAGSHRCNKKCVLCSDHMVETTQFQSSQTGETFTIRHSMSCVTSNIVYLLYCSKCKHSQYVGETKNSLRTRFYLHRSHIRTNTGTCTHVNRHFNASNHSLQDVRCHPIEKQFSDDDSKRREREKFWRQKLKTLFPYGLNAQE